MTTTDPLGESISRLPDNVRAEMARRRTDGVKVAEQMTKVSYATFKRRMDNPHEFTLGNLAELSRILRVPVWRLIDFGGL